MFIFSIFVQTRFDFFWKEYKFYMSDFHKIWIVWIWVRIQTDSDSCMYWFFLSDCLNLSQNSDRFRQLYVLGSSCQTVWIWVWIQTDSDSFYVLVLLVRLSESESEFGQIQTDSDSLDVLVLLVRLSESDSEFRLSESESESESESKSEYKSYFDHFKVCHCKIFWFYV